jgi:hypothetical protein
MIAFRELRGDADLRLAIHSQLTEVGPAERSETHSATSSIISLKGKHRKLLDLYYADQISGADFAVEQLLINSQVSTLEAQVQTDEQRKRTRADASTKFEQLEELLAEIEFDGRFQAVSATSSLSFSTGLRNPRVLRGRSFKLS